MDINKIVAAYVRIRDEKSRLKKEYENAIAALSEKQNVLQSVLLGICKESNIDSVKTESGTAFRTVKTRFWVSDWDAMNSFVVDHYAIDLLEKRLAQNAVKDWIETHPNMPIPTLQTDSKYTIIVRRGQ